MHTYLETATSPSYVHRNKAITELKKACIVKELSESRLAFLMLVSESVLDQLDGKTFNIFIFAATLDGERLSVLWLRVCFSMYAALQTSNRPISSVSV